MLHHERFELAGGKNPGVSFSVEHQFSNPGLSVVSERLLAPEGVGIVAFTADQRLRDEPSVKTRVVDGGNFSSLEVGKRLNV